MSSRKQPQKIIGIDIGSTMIKMVEVFLSDTPKLTKWACVPIPSADSKPSLNNTKEIIEALKLCLRQLKPSTRAASICLSDPAVIIKEMSLPSMGEKEMLENIRFELSEYFSADLKEFKLSYRLFRGIGSKDKMSVLVAAAPISLLNMYRYIVRKSGFNLKYIDVPPNCVSKLLANIGGKDRKNPNSIKNEVICIADLGVSNFEVSIYEGSNFRLNKTIAAVDQNYDESLVYELSQVIDYYHRKNYEFRIARIVLIGGRSYTDGLAEFISKQILLPVEVARPDMFETFGEIKEDFPMALYFKALGSAIREN